MPPNGTRARLNIEGKQCSEVVGMQYSDDCLAVGDETTVTVVNKAGKYNADLRLGQLAELELSSSEVAGGAWSLRHRGRIVARDQSTGEIQITIADLGWHLRESNAPLFKSLKKGTYKSLCDPNGNGLLSETHTGFGLRGVRTTNPGDLRRGLVQSRGEAQADDQRGLEAIHAVQTEPGDTYLDKMTEYSRRLNLLINVSTDSYVQLFTPDYTRRPVFHLVRRRGQSNILDGKKHEDLRTRWTEVEVVGEQLSFEKVNDANDPNATKKRGRVTQRSRINGKPMPEELRNPWPFTHRKTVADGEMYAEGLARRQAEWIYKRGIFDAFWVQYEVEGLFQRSADDPNVVDGIWWTSDQLVQIEDEELGVFGVYWLQSVRGEMGKGDVSTLLIRKPGLLTAAFGRYITPPRQLSEPKGESTAPVVET